MQQSHFIFSGQAPCCQRPSRSRGARRDEPACGACLWFQTRARPRSCGCRQSDGMRERRGPKGPGATMKGVKSWDAIVMGGGVIGLSLALGLRRRGFDILVVEKGEPGREASHAAAGMLAACDPGNPPALRELACASLRLYREFVHQLEDESGLSPDLRMNGILFLGRDGEQYPCAPLGRPEARQIRELEPALATDRGGVLVEGGSVDPRALVAALLKAAKHRGVDLASGSAVCAVEVTDGKASGVKTAKTTFRAPAVVNCA